MTGPEHYREAERLMDSVINRDVLAAEIAVTMAVAQVHATLALAAATALNDGECGMQEAYFKAWHLAAGAVEPLKHETGAA